MWIQNADQNIWNLLQKADLASGVEEGTGDFTGNSQHCFLAYFLPVHTDAGGKRVR
jgi:hypothetical protein